MQEIPLSQDRSEKIAALNDHFRRHMFAIDGKLFLTEGIRSLSSKAQEDIRQSVQLFSAFNEGNDPYQEHDFGAFSQEEVGKVFWKIDYYARDLMHGSEDPSDPDRTVRVRTIMLANEY